MKSIRLAVISPPAHEPAGALSSELTMVSNGPSYGGSLVRLERLPKGDGRLVVELRSAVLLEELERFLALRPSEAVDNEMVEAMRRIELRLTALEERKP